MIKSSKLSVTIHDVEFAKDFQYFISVHYEGNKVCLVVNSETNRYFGVSTESYIY